MQRAVVELIGGLRRFHAAGEAPGPSSGPEEEAPRPGAGEEAPATLVGVASPFGECQVYIPAEEWAIVDRARQWAVSVVMQPSQVDGDPVNRHRCA